MCSPLRALGANPGDKSPASMFEHELHLLPQFRPKALSLNAAWINDLLRMPFIHPKWIWKRVVAPLIYTYFYPAIKGAAGPQWRVRPELLKKLKAGSPSESATPLLAQGSPPAALQGDISFTLPLMDCFA